MQVPSLPVPLPADPPATGAVALQAGLCGTVPGQVVAVALAGGSQTWFVDGRTGQLLPAGQVPAGCGGVLLQPAALSAALPARRFELSERVVDLTLPAATAARVQRRVEVQLSGAGPEQVRIDPAPAGPRASSPGACSTRRSRTPGRLTCPPPGRQALGVEQGAPGEDCVAALLDDAGETLLRVRGGMEGGSTVLLVDRLFSMERSLLGAGTPGAADSRAEATRRGLALLLGTLAVLPDGTTGNWAVLPFTDDVVPAQTAPWQGLAPITAAGQPGPPGRAADQGVRRQPGGLPDPGWLTDLLRAVQQGLYWLGPADQPQRRRLWLWTDGLGPGSRPPTTPPWCRRWDRRAPPCTCSAWGACCGTRSWRGSWPRPAGSTRRPSARPGGSWSSPHAQIDLSEGLVAAVAREVMRGRDAGPLVRGQVQGGTAAGARALVSQFTLPGTVMQNDPWALFLGAWEHADATMDLSVTVNDGVSADARCVRTATAQVCAAAGLQGKWQATLRGGPADLRRSRGWSRPTSPAPGPPRRWAWCHPSAAPRTAPGTRCG